MRNEILQKLRSEVELTSILKTSKRTGVPYASLYRIVHDQSAGHIKNWEKLDEYFKKKNKKTN